MISLDFLRPWAMLALLFLVGGSAQSSAAYPIHNLLGAQPDFILTVLLCAALLSDAATGCVLGFIGGLFSAALIGQTVGTLIVTRTAAGFLAGRFIARLFEANSLVVMLGVFTASLATSILETLVAPQRISFAFWLLAAFGGALWNALLSLPIASLLRFSGWGMPKPRLR